MAKTIEELEKVVEGLTAKLDEKGKELDGLQKLKGTWSNEVGEVRKQSEVLAGELNTAKEAVEALTEDVKTLKSKEPPKTPGKDNPPPVAKVSDKDQADKLESELNEAEKKVVEELYKKLPDDEKKAFKDDDTFRVAVLKQAKAGDSTVNPDSPWRVKTEPSSEDLDKKVKDLFKKYGSGSQLVDERNGQFGKSGEHKKDTGPRKFI